MSTVLYKSPVFGPVHSRRLGVSLGINLMPGDGKVCTFDCIYCECGLNADHRPSEPVPTRSQVAAALDAQLQTMAAEGVLPDVLTFAGNGEPTCHPDFAGVISDTIALRNKYCPAAKVCVLSNSTMIHKPAVREALMKVDDNILKLDTVNPAYISMVDRPHAGYSVDKTVELMKLFNGHLMLQTIFMTGEYRGVSVDNTGEEYVGLWLDVVKQLHPQKVMVYTIDRETPVQGLQKASRGQLDAIRDRVLAMGIDCSASY